MNKSPQNFERLVLVCIDSYDSEKRRILQRFSRSTRFAFFCTAQISNFQQNLRDFFFIFSAKYSRYFQFFVVYDFFQKNDEFSPEFHETFRNFLRKQRKCWFAENLLIFDKFQICWYFRKKSFTRQAAKSDSRGLYPGALKTVVNERVPRATNFFF